jgi:hypothetical protein
MTLKSAQPDVKQQVRGFACRRDDPPPEFAECRCGRIVVPEFRVRSK